MNEQVKRFKPVKIDVMSFAKTFDNRRVKYVKRINDDGSLDIEHGYIDGVASCGKELYLRIRLEGSEYIYSHCFPEYLINSGNDFSK